MSEQKPNILWLILDCARYDRISAHGYHKVTTPFLDELAATGLDYQLALSAAVWSLPSYTSLLSGIYPRYHGVNVAGYSLQENVSTLAEQLQSVGYRTACFSNNAWLEPTFGVGRGFDRFDRLWFSAQATPLAKASFIADRLWGVVQGNLDKGARRTNRRVEGWLESHPKETPTFTFVAYVEPHTPYTYHRSAGWFNVPSDIDEYEWVRSLPAAHQFAPETLAKINGRYDIEMQYIDGIVNELLTSLKRKGLLEQTIVIVTADHGELLGEEHMLGHQFSVAEPVRRVPLILWAPWKWSQGQKINDIVQTIDLPMTISQWAGIDWAPSPHTHLLPEADGQGSRQFAITDYPVPHLSLLQRLFPNVDLSQLDMGLTCISDKEHKLVYTSKGEWQQLSVEMASLKEEAVPLATTPVINELKRELEAYTSQALVEEREGVDIPDEVTDHLRALGYVD